MCPYPDDNNSTPPLSDQEFIQKYKESSLPGQQSYTPEGRFTNSGETFYERTSGSTSAFGDEYENIFKSI